MEKSRYLYRLAHSVVLAIEGACSLPSLAGESRLAWPHARVLTTPPFLWEEALLRPVDSNRSLFIFSLRNGENPTRKEVWYDVRT
jgi:hypothetical protein